MWEVFDLWGSAGLMRTSDANGRANGRVGLSSFHFYTVGWLWSVFLVWKLKIPKWLDGMWWRKERRACVYWRAEIELAYVSPVGISTQLSSMSSEVCTNEFDTSHLLAHARPRAFTGLAGAQRWAAETRRGLCWIIFFFWDDDAQFHKTNLSRRNNIHTLERWSKMSRRKVTVVMFHFTYPTSNCSSGCVSGALRDGREWTEISSGKTVMTPACYACSLSNKLKPGWPETFLLVLGVNISVSFFLPSTSVVVSIKSSTGKASFKHPLSWSCHTSHLGEKSALSSRITATTREVISHTIHYAGESFTPTCGQKKHIQFIKPPL